MPVTMHKETLGRGERPAGPRPRRADRRGVSLGHGRGVGSLVGNLPVNHRGLPVAPVRVFIGQQLYLFPAFY